MRKKKHGSFALLAVLTCFLAFCIFPSEKCSASNRIDGTLPESPTERTGANFGNVTVKYGNAYNYLRDNEKFLYDAIYVATSDYSKLMPLASSKYSSPVEFIPYSYKFYESSTTSIDDVYTSSEYEHALFAFRDDFPEKATNMIGNYTLYSTKEADKYVAYLTWIHNDNLNLEQVESMVNTKISSIANSAIAAGTTKAEQELYVHDYLINNIAYENEFSTFENAYGGLILGKTQCVGYAASFDAVMKKLGISCLQISGRASLSGHQRNMVQLDGQWYEVDVTADDGDYKYDATHKHFNRTTTDFKSKNDTYMSYDRHEDQLSYKYPEATGTKYTYDYIVPERNDDGSIGITSVKFNNFSYEQRVYLHVGDTLDVSCTTTPDNATNKELIIYSSDTSVATISGNTLTAVGIGGAGITAYPVNQNEHVQDAHDWFEVFVVADDVDISGSNNSGTSSSSSQSSSSSSTSSNSSSSESSSATTGQSRKQSTRAFLHQRNFLPKQQRNPLPLAGKNRPRTLRDMRSSTLLTRNLPRM
ncbi:MAG: hypothetical protein E7301_13365 [Butyrivibrio sp.]|nr:hypothetical protein [Butyrivibrio sp.]